MRSGYPQPDNASAWREFRTVGNGRGDPWRGADTLQALNRSPFGNLILTVSSLA
jgi:hypothetical protein